MPAPSVPGTTLRQTAERIVVGEDRLVAVRDFLDQIPRRGSEELATMIEEEPQVTGDGEADALLAAIALAFDARRVTRDIDAVFEPKIEIYEEAGDMARDEGLPDGWLNDAVKSFLAGPDEAAAVALDLPGLRVSTASARALLALKVLAHRVGEDEEDVRLLARELHLSTADEVLAVQRRRLAIGSSRLPASSSRSCSRDAARHPRRGRGVPVCPDHEPAVPEPRLKGPDTSDVIQPPWNPPS